MTKIDVTLSSEYGIMFLYDTKVKPKFPDNSGRNPVMSTSTCLAFNVLTYVDGDAKIIISNASTDAIDVEYFTGEIECSSNSISLYDHNGFAFASAPLRDSFARVSLRMSDERNPAIVWCVIENMETF